MCGDRGDLWASLLLAGLTLSAFGGVCANDFVNFDDPGYVTENRHVKEGLTANSLWWACTTGSECNWHPLTWISLQLDYELYRLHPWGFHLTNLLLHTANTLLLFLVLRRMTGARWRSVLVAALFAVHPLHVESVAWVAERKDVLSTLFWMLTLWAYLRYIERPYWFRYLLVVVALGLGLMAKPMLVTLPFVLLLLDYWPLGRLAGAEESRSNGSRNQTQPARKSHSLAGRGARLVYEKLPLFALVLISSVVTLRVQSRALAALPLETRVMNALVSYTSYLGKTFWPVDLVVFYPSRHGTLSAGSAAAAALLLVGITAGVLWAGRKRPYLPVGWFWYLGTLVPVIGLVQVGDQAMADRYTYVPLIGVFIMLAWGLHDLLSPYVWGRKVLVLASTTTVLACALGTWNQVKHWHNRETLWEHALAATQSPQAHINLGRFRLQEGQWQSAEEHFTAALRISPTSSQAHTSYGVVLFMKGDGAGAASHLLAALRQDPGNAKAHLAYGQILLQRGEFDEARRHLTLARDTEPPELSAFCNLGLLWLWQGQLPKAREELRAALTIDPACAEAHLELGVVLHLEGHRQEATEHLTAGEQAKPAKRSEAEHLRGVVANNLAWILATTNNARLRDGRLAVKMAQLACHMGRQEDPNYLDTLAAAFAEDRQFEKATATVQKALALADQTQQSELAGRLKTRRDLYAKGQPFRER
jgi:Tfp pilus assembly protein PilF